jgi:hypothetical protein
MSDNQAPLVAIIHTASEVGDRVRASQCHRYDATHVSCLARFELSGCVNFARDG